MKIILDDISDLHQAFRIMRKNFDEPKLQKLREKASGIKERDLVEIHAAGNRIFIRRVGTLRGIGFRHSIPLRGRIIKPGKVALQREHVFGLKNLVKHGGPCTVYFGAANATCVFEHADVTIHIDHAVLPPYKELQGFPDAEYILPACEVFRKLKRALKVHRTETYDYHEGIKVMPTFRQHHAVFFQSGCMMSTNGTLLYCTPLESLPDDRKIVIPIITLHAVENTLRHCHGEDLRLKIYPPLPYESNQVAEFCFGDISLMTEIEQEKVFPDFSHALLRDQTRKTCVFLKEDLKNVQLVGKFQELIFCQGDDNKALLEVKSKNTNIKEQVHGRWYPFGFQIGNQSIKEFPHNTSIVNIATSILKSVIDLDSEEIYFTLWSSLRAHSIARLLITEYLPDENQLDGWIIEVLQLLQQNASPQIQFNTFESVYYSSENPTPTFSFSSHSRNENDN
jgi:hypothetical protein